uniref:Anaphase-promoting complex subunit 4 WD40 domain-containing protein n=2 Tax=Dunaliella tertiolecta TaxID=3047 RepID=A0A7S3QXD8_DUNTE|mmetsp:Transcript_18494/g.51898  ORF Transcript_18494/g.51898 Transcript_18494/m.51898 type:complete len:444 (+) Transcript_18494:100-1431(+)
MPVDQATLACCRQYILDNDRSARVQRELWSNQSGTYLGLQDYILCLKAQGISLEEAAANRQANAALSLHAPTFSTNSFEFSGTHSVLTDSKAGITVLAFANVRNDLLAFANTEGDLFLSNLHPDSTSTVIKAERMHRRPIASLDWSLDNTQLLSGGEDGLVIWDACTATAMRTINHACRSHVCCSHFYTPNCALALVGTTSGALEVINCSSGTVDQSYKVPAPFRHTIQITAVECSLQHVFAGDSEGTLHMYNAELAPKGQLHRLMWLTKVRAAASKQSSPVIAIQHVPFCGATDSPVLLVTTRDSTISIVALYQHNRMSVHTRCVVPPMARNLRASVCPLSVIQDLPRVVMGSEDASVYIYNCSGSPQANSNSARNAAGLLRGGLLLGSAVSSAAAVNTPLVMKSLKGHRSPIGDVCWAFDESRLASGDSDGFVHVWERSIV